MDGERDEPTTDDIIRGFAVYRLDTERIGNRPVTAYGDRLAAMGFEEDESIAYGLVRRFLTQPDIRITVRGYNQSLDLDNAVTITAPVEVDVYTKLPYAVFEDMDEYAVGTYEDENFFSYVSAPKNEWKTAEV